MRIEYLLISAAITLVALLMLIITIHSYRIYRNRRLLFVISAFLFFFARGIVLSVGVFFPPFEVFATSYYTWLLDIVILILLYGAAMQRRDA